MVRGGLGLGPVPTAGAERSGPCSSIRDLAAANQSFTLDHIAADVDPFGRAVHLFSLAAAISDEAQNRWVTVASYGITTLVGSQRIYRQAHWTSAVLAIATSRTTVRWLGEHGLWKILPPLATAP